MTVTHDPRFEVTAHQLDELVRFALLHLSDFRVRSGLYCYDTSFGGQPRGESIRYSLMVLLGAQRALAAGLPEFIDLDELWERCLSRRDEFTPGDIGLALWADARRDGRDTAGLLHQLDSALQSESALQSLVGMEVAWILVGVAQHTLRSGRGEDMLRTVSDHLRSARRARSGLYRHDAASRTRRHLPNFATEIYTLLALATIARTELVPRALEDAIVLARQLVRLRLPDGGWPWLFDAERAVVVEPYEIYTVHQDAMAPMAFLELADATGDKRWVREATAGVPWSRGSNELGVDLLDLERGFAHRSIRRRRPWDRVSLAVNAIATRGTGRPLVGRSSRVEINQTSRPYHLGWILEAWAGRSVEWTEAGK